MPGDAAADNLIVSDPVAKRWTKYGHDRLYVQTAEGTRLGYWDNKTRTAVLVDGADQAAFDAALTAHRGDQPPAVVAVPAQAAAVEPPPPVSVYEPTLVATPREPVEDVTALVTVESETPQWSDLADTRAGAAAREQALALKQAAPVKTFLARALGVKTEERAWRIGADGEEAVAARLRKLGDRWKVLHAIPVGENGSDIDHVVVGPGGVFTINTKHHPNSAVWVGGNTFMVDGQRVPYVRNSRFEARRTSKFLTAALGGVPVSTTGVIAVMGARKGFTVKAQPPDGEVVVITRREVAKWLAKRPEVLTDMQVEALYAVARRSVTWR